ncbi:MAG: DUF616 domain-containing protein [Betaproteobacteria bacterium]|nr:MAG: DUF616 domain-containing protein [Betaproteobacteria bacterium]
MNVVVYSCVVNNYDRLMPPRILPKGVSFVCFTDAPKKRVKGWEMQPLAQPSEIHDPALVNRYHKFFSHRVLPDADLSIYVDGNLRIEGDLGPLLDQFIASNVAMACPRHPERSDVIDEARFCEYLGKFNSNDTAVIDKQLATYADDGMPSDAPLSENYLILRNHRAEGLDAAMSLWWDELLRFTRRDQISLPYVLWKTGLPYRLIEENASAPNPYFSRYEHRRGGVQGLRQIVRLRRNEWWWCRLIYNVGQNFRRFSRRRPKSGLRDQRYR